MKYKFDYKWLKHNGALGIQTQGSRMGGEVVSTQLWELHKSEIFSGSNSLSASSNGSRLVVMSEMSQAQYER